MHLSVLLRRAHTMRFFAMAVTADGCDCPSTTQGGWAITTVRSDCHCKKPHCVSPPLNRNQRNAAVTPSRKIRPVIICMHVSQYLQNGMGRGYVVALIESTGNFGSGLSWRFGGEWKTEHELTVTRARAKPRRSDESGARTQYRRPSKYYGRIAWMH